MGNWNGDCLNSNITEKSMTSIRESDKIYHGCFIKNKDGTNKLIKKGEKCLTPAHFPFLEIPVGCSKWRYSPHTRKTKQKKDYCRKSLINTFKISKIFNGD